MNCIKLAAPPSILAAAMAIKNRRNGTESPSLRPASTLSACRTRMGTRGLFTMICPRPASVGARMAARIPASQIESCGKTRRAATAPRKMVSNMPTLSSRAGRLFDDCAKHAGPVRLASVKSSMTRPTSAMRRNSPCVDAWLENFMQGRKHQHARDREHDGCGDEGLLQPAATAGCKGREARRRSRSI